MNKTLKTVLAIGSSVLLAASFLLVFVWALKDSVWSSVKSIIGLVIGFAVAPILHECGHIAFARIAKMDVVYAKFFCFQIKALDGKKQWGLASPFEDDQTQVVPTHGGDMKKRAKIYTIGGLVIGGAFLLIVLVAAILLTKFGKTDYLLWGIVPYAAYLVVLNLLPVEYSAGKTDMLVFVGLQKDNDAEKVMLSAMEIQGQLYEGKSFTEIDETLYFNLPQLCEDEPLYAVMLDLRYRYYLEKGEIEKASDQLNRLAKAQEYLASGEVEKVAAELVYMHSLTGNLELAEESGKLCQYYLQGDSVTAKRVLAAFSKASNKIETVGTLIAQAEEAMSKELLAGVCKFERILLSRIQEA